MTVAPRYSRVQKKGQVTIPASLRDKMGLKEGDLVAFSETSEGILISPQKVFAMRTFDRIGDALKAQEITLDEVTIMALLADQPTPEAILAIQPSSALQARVSELLAQSKAGALNRQEEAELDRYLTLEHLVRLAKVQAYRRLNLHP